MLSKEEGIHGVSSWGSTFGNQPRVLSIIDTTRCAFSYARNCRHCFQCLGLRSALKVRPLIITPLTLFYSLSLWNPVQFLFQPSKCSSFLVVQLLVEIWTSSPSSRFCWGKELLITILCFKKLAAKNGYLSLRQNSTLSLQKSHSNNLMRLKMFVFQFAFVNTVLQNAVLMGWML